MKGNKEVLNALNEALAGELLAISQYSAHAAMDRNWGYMALADHLRKESIDQMGHAERLMDRILYLEGAPEVQATEQPHIGQTVTEQLQNDLVLEHRAVKSLNKNIAVARAKGDNASADLLADILADEEEHVSWIETQLGQIEKLGESTWLLGQLRV